MDFSKRKAILIINVKFLLYLEQAKWVLEYGFGTIVLKVYKQDKTSTTSGVVPKIVSIYLLYGELVIPSEILKGS